MSIESGVPSECIYDKKPAVYWVKDWKVGELQVSANLSNSFNGWRTSKPRTRGDTGEVDLEENDGLLTSITEGDDQ